jgi:D-sedoheptulose 7-phosphate isomerase
VHVFFEHRGLLEGRSEQRVHDVGASSFLYPFLGEQEHDLDAVLADVAASAMAKGEEASALREQTVDDGAETLRTAAAELRASLHAGGRLLALGNGGSATDAMDVVADFAGPPAATGWPARRALDLTADTAIITALANDIGTEAIFARQVIAYGRPGDVLIALSTSGNSLSVLEALGEARRRGLRTIALVGYDGGRVAAEGLADHVVVTRSQHIPRIQEAQATAYHVLRELVES